MQADHTPARHYCREAGFIRLSRATSDGQGICPKICIFDVLIPVMGKEPLQIIRYKNRALLPSVSDNLGYRQLSNLTTLAIMKHPTTSKIINSLSFCIIVMGETDTSPSQL